MRFPSLSCVACMFFASSFALMTTAFSTELPPVSTNGWQHRRPNSAAAAAAAAASTRRQSYISSLAMAPVDDNEDAERRSGNPAIELSSTLARLDRQFQIQQSNKPGSRWTKLVLQPDNDDDDPSQDFDSNNPMSPTQQQDFVYLLEPPNKSNPSCIICFTGGAGLGTFPQVAYNEFLLRLSNRLGAAIITAPYSVGLDHFALAKTVGELHRRALIQCQDKLFYSSNLRTYCIAHSLGCKLATIYMAATGLEYDGVAFMSFNNFGFGQTIGMAREFTQQIRQSSMGGGTSGAGGGGFGGGGGGGGFESFMGNAAGAMGGDTMNNIFNFAESLLGNIGIEFSPNPTDTERLISLRYSPERQAKTRLFVFDDDTLDSTPSFLQACRGSTVRRRPFNVDGDDDNESNDTSNVAADDDDNKDIVQVSALPGTHLTPVYFKLGLEEIIEDEEARNVARELVQERGIPEAASFGNEQEMNALIDEVCGFILGKGPTTRPSSSSSSRPLLSTSSTTTTTAGGGSPDDSS